MENDKITYQDIIDLRESLCKLIDVWYMQLAREDCSLFIPAHTARFMMEEKIKLAEQSLSNIDKKIKNKKFDDTVYFDDEEGYKLK